MRFAEITERLAHLGGAKWDVHSRARRMVAEGHEVIELTIGEPDVSTPGALIDVAAAAMRSGRTGYSNGRGEPALLCALARRYSQRSGRTIGANQIICLPGTQTSLYAVLNALLQPGDEILVGDPMYATYEGLIAATGAAMVPVPLRPETGFRMQAADVADRITPRSRAPQTSRRLAIWRSGTICGSSATRSMKSLSSTGPAFCRRCPRRGWPSGWLWSRRSRSRMRPPGSGRAGASGRPSSPPGFCRWQRRCCSATSPSSPT